MCVHTCFPRVSVRRPCSGAPPLVGAGHPSGGCPWNAQLASGTRRGPHLIHSPDPRPHFQPGSVLSPRASLIKRRRTNVTSPSGRADVGPSARAGSVPPPPSQRSGHALMLSQPRPLPTLSAAPPHLGQGGFSDAHLVSTVNSRGTAGTLISLFL